MFSIYQNNIPKTAKLSNAELLDLLHKKHEFTARDRIVFSFMPWVMVTARRVVRNGIDVDDIIGEGALGLLYAIDKFDCTKSTSFVKYAKKWVTGTIHRYVHYNMNIVINNPKRDPINFENTTQALGLMEEYIEQDVDAELDDRISLDQLCSSLRPSTRDMLKRRYGLGTESLEFNAIGGLLGITGSSVCNRLKGAIKRLKRLYDEDAERVG